MKQQPNILFLMTDQQRFDTIRALGNNLIKTPAMDRLVNEGTAFTHCYTPSPVCISARCSLITGLPAHRTRCTDNIAMPQHLPSFMERLRDAGYQTHGTGKMHFSPDPTRMWGFESRDISEEIASKDDYTEFVKTNGFDHLASPGGLRSEYYYIPQPSQLPARLHHSTWVADRSIDFLKRRDKTRPFFLWSSWIKPHPPFESPAPWQQLYRCAEMELPFRPEGYEELLNFWNKVQNRYKYRDAGRDDLLLRTMRAAYLASISFVDYNIARVLEALGDELDNTLILFTSDHGDLMGDYESFGKRSMLDFSVRVPLLMRWPGQVDTGKQCNTPASHLDLWPTLLEAAGIDDSHVCEEGVNLCALAAGAKKRRTVYSQFQQRNTGLYMAADHRWKYIYSASDRKEWLLRITPDGHEAENLADDLRYSSVLADMRERLISRFQRDGYTSAVKDDTWRTYPPADFPSDPDEGLLYQDGATLQPMINTLGEYSRLVTVKDPEAVKLIYELIELTVDTQERESDNHG